MKPQVAGGRRNWQLSFDPMAAILREGVVLAIIVICVAVPSIAWADFSYPNFTSVAGLTMNGSAGQSGATLRLTPNIGGQAGSCWRTVSKVHLSGGFDTTFTFQMSGDVGGGGGADGMAFVIQNESSTALGSGGSGLGYDGIASCLAVELDTFGFGHETNNHVSIQTNGFFGNSAQDINSIGQYNAFVDLNNNDVHTLRVKYRPGYMLVFLDSIPAPVLNVAVDLENINGSSILDGTGNAWVGFTGGTGLFYQTHDVTSWSLAETAAALPTGGCCMASGCVISDAHGCAAVHAGFYGGDGSSCETLDCTGACCAASSCSWPRTVADCAAVPGTFMGVGSACDAVNCTGACCEPTGLCQITDQGDCESNLSGVYHGSGTSCWPLPCPLPSIGACCVDGDCNMILLTECTAPGAIFYGQGTQCNDIFCGNPPDPFGACCQLNGACVQNVTETACIYFRGHYNGDETHCAEVACASPGCSCVGATPLSGVAFFDDSTIGLTACDGPTCVGGGASPAKVYAYTATESGLGIVNTYNGITDFDTVISLHSGCPMTAANELWCNDDSGNLGAQVQFCAVAGQTYYVRVGGVSGASGHFTLLALVIAQNVQEGPFQNPANGHWYYLIATGPWSGAEQAAQAKGGHLVTINDAAENAWVNSTFNTSGLFIGLNDVANEGTFVWASGQPVTYTNWEVGEPSNGGGVEDYATMEFSGKWLDQDQCSGTSGLQSVVEVTTVPLPGLLAGPIVNPANCHTYYFTQPATWIEAQMKAQALGGNLVTINDAAENEYVRSHFANYGGNPQAVWIGLTDRTTEGTFTWVDGSPVTYTNWNPGEPNDLGNEDYVTMNEPATGGWNDAHSGESLSAVIEITTGPCKGDMNCNGSVTVADIPLFIQALLGTPGFPGCDVTRADVNNDGLNNGRDVKPFVALLTAP